MSFDFYRERFDRLTWHTKTFTGCRVVDKLKNNNNISCWKWVLSSLYALCLQACRILILILEWRRSDDSAKQHKINFSYFVVSNIRFDLQLLHNETSTTKITYNLKIKFCRFVENESLRFNANDDVMLVWLPLMLICLKWNDLIELQQFNNTNNLTRRTYFRNVRMCVGRYATNSRFSER